MRAVVIACCLITTSFKSQTVLSLTLTRGPTDFPQDCIDSLEPIWDFKWIHSGFVIRDVVKTLPLPWCLRFSSSCNTAFTLNKVTRSWCVLQCRGRKRFRKGNLLNTSFQYLNKFNFPWAPLSRWTPLSSQPIREVTHHSVHFGGIWTVNQSINKKTVKVVESWWRFVMGSFFNI